MDIDKWIKEAEYKAGLASENNRLDDMHYNRGIADCLKALKISTYGPESTMQENVICAIKNERTRQDKKWGEQNHLPHYWTGILGEEYGEFCEAVNETVFNNGPEEQLKGGYENMRKEAIHVAAVALGFLECLERNKRDWFSESNGQGEKIKESCFNQTIKQRIMKTICR